ncbi:hypothetical protein [Variovorax sp. DAIF25]|uniref:hypothetical protein n=1 Tax=Variovorax sp. DAIF25 TaxID=3080983 RepID=UPI003D6C4BF4
MSNKNPIHGFKKARWWQKKWFAETLSAVPAAAAAFVAAYKAKLDSGDEVFWILVFGGCWLTLSLIFKVIHAKYQDDKEKEANSHDGLTAALWVLHESVARVAGLPEADFKKLRVTFHRVVPPLNDTDKIEQVVNYVGGERNGAGRFFPIRSGITGSAIRTNEVLFMDRESENFNDYQRELIKEWHYTEKDAREATSDRFSAMAIPVKSRDGQKVLGVVYLDCDQKKFFANPQVAEAVMNGCGGITRYIGERYV